ncbi:MAG TPA: flagellar motor protein MotB [bacterium]|nr:flagellar motor protein MotB [bacterium]
MGRKKQEPEHENLERWLLTYADLITLLLAFFITMYSMSRVDAKKFGAVQVALQGVLHGGRSAFEGRQPGMPTDDKRQNLLTPNSMRMLQERLGRSIATKADSTKKDQTKNLKISTSIDERGLVIRVMENAFFETGKADLTPAARDALDAIGVVVQGISNYIRVEGHTDNVPIHNQDFASNWELSTARATTVVRYFLDHYGFHPERISASGYAEFRPIASNDTPESRAKNRRVDIVILSSQKGGDEPATPQGAPTGLDLPQPGAANSTPGP